MNSTATSITFAPISLPKSGVAVVLAGDGPKLFPTAAKLDQAGARFLQRAAKVAKFKGKKRTALDLLCPAQVKLDRLCVVGTGKIADYAGNDWASLGGVIRSRLTGREGGEATVVIEGPGRPDTVSSEEVAEIALGLTLRGYKFSKYKSAKSDEDKSNNGNDSKSELKKIVVQCADPAAARRAYLSRKAIADGVLLARDLVNEPANILGPKEFAAAAKALDKLGVKVEVLDEKALTKLGMRALLAVGQGSARPSLVAVMRWTGAASKDSKPVAIVGKGVCFDTGGISLKPAQGMEDMKGDMAGAACVVGLMHALAARKAKVNAVGVIGLVENMPSGTAQRPGDVVKAMSGTTIEVLNTDAEGRMVLADILWYTQQRFKPRWVVNLATLTGAVLVALGKEHAGMFSNDDKLCDQLTAAGKTTGETVWRLPLGPKYDEMIDSKVADIKNTGGRYAGSTTAAQFLQRFIKKGTPWVHLDIAGTGMAANKSDVSESWASGYGVRLLDRLIGDHYEG
ncbi:MAG: leucyl aminopeptidase [Pseudomonadota bacterium]|nr:leucyl aminopeptidase [Pseudomonadota bacterium]